MYLWLLKDSEVEKPWESTGFHGCIFSLDSAPHDWHAGRVTQTVYFSAPGWPWQTHSCLFPPVCCGLHAPRTQKGINQQQVASPPCPAALGQPLLTHLPSRTPSWSLKGSVPSVLRVRKLHARDGRSDEATRPGLQLGAIQDQTSFL